MAPIQPLNKILLYWNYGFQVDTYMEPIMLKDTSLYSL